jgi:hypothetical protein
VPDERVRGTWSPALAKVYKRIRMTTSPLLNISSVTENGDQNYTFESLPVERGARGAYRYNDKRQTQYQLCPY